MKDLIPVEFDGPPHGVQVRPMLRDLAVGQMFVFETKHGFAKAGIPCIVTDERSFVYLDDGKAIGIDYSRNERFVRRIEAKLTWTPVEGD